MIPILENVLHRNLLSFWNVIPWIDSKINQRKSIKEWIDSTDYDNKTKKDSFLNMKKTNDKSRF